jgi:deoxyribodipyrimidine photo-lyase
MRQLLSEGWMHNRVRMIAAMFLTKHLLIDWREGERHFAGELVDLDFASNNGGWQWSASTGTDAAPYFRIFNPYSQSRRFDPEGAYIRAHVAELADVEAGALHEEGGIPEPVRNAIGYPGPIVEHARGRARALEAFEAISS